MSEPSELHLSDGRVVPLRDPPIWRAAPLLRDYATRDSFGARGPLHFAMVALAWEAGRDELRRFVVVASDPKERAAYQQQHAALEPPWRPLAALKNDLVAWGEHIAEVLATEDYLALDRLGDQLCGAAFRRIWPEPKKIEEKKDFSGRTSEAPSGSSPGSGSGSSGTQDGSSP